MTVALQQPFTISYEWAWHLRRAGLTQEELAARLGVSLEDFLAWEKANESSDPLDRLEWLLGRLSEYVEALKFEKEYRTTKS